MPSELRLTEKQLDAARRTVSGRGPFGTPVEMREGFNRALLNADVTLVIVNDDDEVERIEAPPSPDDEIRTHVIRVTTMVSRDYGLYLSGHARAGLRQALEEMYRLGRASVRGTVVPDQPTCTSCGSEWTMRPIYECLCRNATGVKVQLS